MQTHRAAAALHYLALAVRQAVGVSIDLLSGSGTVIKVKLAAAQAELAVRDQPAAAALQAARVNRQRAAAGMGNLAGLIIQGVGAKGQVAAIGRNTPAAVIQVALQRQREIVAAGLRNLALLAGEIVSVQIELIRRQRAAVVIQPFAGAGAELLLRGDSAVARNQIAVAGVEGDIFPLRPVAAEIQPLPARGQVAARQVLPLRGQLA